MSENRNLNALGWPTLIEALSQRCQTVLGIEQAGQWQPVYNCSAAGSQLEQTAEILHLLRKKSGEFSLNGIFDCRPYLAAAKKAVLLTPAALAEILSTLRSADELLKEIDLLLTDRSPLLPLLKRYRRLDEVTYLIEQVIDERGRIRDSASRELQALRQKIGQLNREIHQQLLSILRTQFPEEYFQDDYVTLREDRLVLPLKANMKGKFPGIIHATSGSGQTFFIEPSSVVEPNNELKWLYEQERQEIERILRQVTQVIGDFGEAIANNLEVIAQLDLVIAKARLSRDLKGQVVRVIPIEQRREKALHIKQARHPLMILAGQTCVANDWQLNPQTNTLILSGPNTGGKTVAMTTFGTIVLLVAGGVLPPVEVGSTIPIPSRLMIAMGDAQDLQAGLSSFSGHLKQIGAILAEADNESLVLLDELMNGTNAREGEALAQAVLEQLNERGATTLVTTHYSALKNLADEDPRFHNASLAMDPETGRATYRLVDGIAGESNALGIARSSGFNTPLIDRAAALLGPLEKRRHQELELLISEKAQWQEKNSQLTKTQKELEEAKRALEVEKQRWQQQAKVSFQEQTADFRLQLAQTRRQLRELVKSVAPEKLSATKRTLENALETIATQGAQHGIDLRPPAAAKVGDTVKLVDGGQVGEVTAALDKHGHLEVTVGSLRMRLHPDELEVLTQPAATAKRAANAATAPAEEIPFTPRSERNSLDIRGWRLEEALSELEKFIDQKTLAGEGRLVIIHGHGTDRLKKGVRDFLEQTRYELRFRAGHDVEGGNGVTVVEIG